MGRRVDGLGVDVEAIIAFVAGQHGADLLVWVGILGVADLAFGQTTGHMVAIQVVGDLMDIERANIRVVGIKFPLADKTGVDGNATRPALAPGVGVGVQFIAGEDGVEVAAWFTGLFVEIAGLVQDLAIIISFTHTGEGDAGRVNLFINARKGHPGHQLARSAGGMAGIGGEIEGAALAVWSADKGFVIRQYIGDRHNRDGLVGQRHSAVVGRAIGRALLGGIDTGNRLALACQAQCHGAGAPRRGQFKEEAVIQLAAIRVGDHSDRAAGVDRIEAAQFGAIACADQLRRHLLNRLAGERAHMAAHKGRTVGDKGDIVDQILDRLRHLQAKELDGGRTGRYLEEFNGDLMGGRLVGHGEGASVLAGLTDGGGVDADAHGCRCGGGNGAVGWR